jgi:hypothetical protein
MLERMMEYLESLPASERERIARLVLVAMLEDPALSGFERRRLEELRRELLRPRRKAA